MIGNILAGALYKAPIVGDFESIATVTVGSGGTSAIDFTSIPGTFQHLQIRAIARSTRTASTGDFFSVQFNGDTTSSYYYGHGLYGDGATAAANANGAGTSIFMERIACASQNTGVFSGGVIDILDYANTNKNKTTRHLMGWDNNGATNPGQIFLGSGLWIKTNAITSIKIVTGAGAFSFAQYSHFALYGIKG